MKHQICKICKRNFIPKSESDIYCGILCLNASITNEEQENAIINIWDRDIIYCPICKRHKKFLINKRMNGQWYLWQEYHYDNNQKSIFACYYCNLWEMNYRRRNKINLTPNEHSILINKEEKEDDSLSKV